jgi:HPr kinase/phosphorylase
MKLTVRQMIEDLKDKVKFEVIAGQDSLDTKITEHDINRPGLALAGYFEHFGYKRIQLLGKGEVAYLSHLSDWARKRLLIKMFSYDICCFIIAWGQDVPSDFIKFAQEHKVPVIKTNLSTGKITTLLTLYLEEKFAEKKTIHGGLVDIAGIGVLLIGEAGVGKSEVTLELIKRGHRLVADDVVEIHKIGNTLVGTAPEITKYHMEIRGLGIVDVRSLFGMSAICEKIEVELVAELKSVDLTSSELKGVLALESDNYKLLDVMVPKILIPVQPGRDIAALVEVGAMNLRLKKMGYDSMKNFEEEVLRKLKQKRQNNT